MNPAWLPLHTHLLLPVVPWLTCSLLHIPSKSGKELSTQGGGAEIGPAKMRHRFLPPPHQPQKLWYVLTSFQLTLCFHKQKDTHHSAPLASTQQCSARVLIWTPPRFHKQSKLEHIFMPLPPLLVSPLQSLASLITSC